MHVYTKSSVLLLDGMFISVAKTKRKKQSRIPKKKKKDIPFRTPGALKMTN